MCHTLYYQISHWLKDCQLLACMTLLFQQIVKLQKTVIKKPWYGGKWNTKTKEYCIEINKACFKRKKSGNNVKSASNKNKVVSINDNSTKNVVFEPDIEDKPNIDFYNRPEVLNDEDEPSIDFDDTLNYLLLIM